MVADRGALASALDSGTHARAESSGLIRQRSEEHDDASQTPVVRSFTYVDPVENHRPVRAEDLPLIPSESVVLVDTSGDVDRHPGNDHGTRRSAPRSLRVPGTFLVGPPVQPCPSEPPPADVVVRGRPVRSKLGRSSPAPRPSTSLHSPDAHIAGCAGPRKRPVMSLVARSVSNGEGASSLHDHYVFAGDRRHCPVP
jgi:hypothetical protein